MKSYFAYIRVSTVKQGEHGSSLQEQRDAIEAFARRSSLQITGWFEERETAAKTGREHFTRMLSALKRHKADGVIFHKIDRSARNLKDWSVIQDLADQGIDVRFTQESVNLTSNEGRLTGDFLAVIASHYIRNLRDEVKRGMHGRLKQGIYPLAAPLGYLDQGGGKAKIPDPLRAPLIREAFELYAAGAHSLRALRDELFRRGLRNKSGKRYEANNLAKMFRNPFYLGIIRMRRSGEVFQGVHTPIIPKRLFDQVQNVLDGKRTYKIVAHDFLYRRMIVCGHCRRCLVGELQKGHVYYRCHTPRCPTRTLREEAIDQAILSCLGPLGLSDHEATEVLSMIDTLHRDQAGRRDELLKSIDWRAANVESRLGALMDAYLDGAFDRKMFDQKKLSLLMERQSLEERRGEIPSEQLRLSVFITESLEPLKSLQLSYKMGNIAERRDLLKTLTSNLQADGKHVAVKLRSPFHEAAKLPSVSSGGLARDNVRTERAQKLFKILVKHFIMREEQLKREGDALLAA
jgi:site-specific DNA recombinase